MVVVPESQMRNRAAKSVMVGLSLTADGKLFPYGCGTSYNTPMPPRSLEIGPAGRAAARAIERTRVARGYSQRQLAARVLALGRPMTFTALSRIERTVRRCDIDDLVAIAAALGTPPQALLADWPTELLSAGEAAT